MGRGERGNLDEGAGERGDRERKHCDGVSLKARGKRTVRMRGRMRTATPTVSGRNADLSEAASGDEVERTIRKAGLMQTAIRAGRKGRRRAWRGQKRYPSRRTLRRAGVRIARSSRERVANGIVRHRGLARRHPREEGTRNRIGLCGRSSLPTGRGECRNA